MLWAWAGLLLLPAFSFLLPAVERSDRQALLVQAEETIKSLSDKDLVERLAKIAEQKYAVGQVSQPDVLRSQVELSRLINRVITETLAIDGA